MTASGGVPSAHVGDETVCRCGHSEGEHYASRPRPCKKRCRCVSFELPPAGPVEPVADTEAVEETAPYQRKGVNAFLPDAPVRKTFTDEAIMQRIESWCDAEREKEAWHDGYTQAYRYRANLLEAALVRWRAAATRPVPSSSTREEGETTVEYSLVRDSDGYRYGGYNEDCRAPGCDCYLTARPEAIVGEEHIEQREVYRGPWRRAGASS